MGSKNKKNKNKKSPDTTTPGTRVFGGGNKPITDKRFSLSEKDPRFQEAPKHKNKVAIDKRFERMFTDKNFSTASAPVDKRGKPVKKDDFKSRNALKEYYRIDDVAKSGKDSDHDMNLGHSDDQEDADVARRQKDLDHDSDLGDSDDDEGDDVARREKDSDHDSDLGGSDDEEDDDVAKKGKYSDPGLGLGDGDEEEDDDVASDEDESDEDAKKVKNGKAKVSEALSDLESESEESGDEESGEEGVEEYLTDTEDDEVYMEEEDDALEEEDVPDIDKETHRLAVVNLDWEQVRAVDLFVVLSSFVKKSGQILSVTVYPSEFGLKRIEEEKVRGPFGLIDNENGKNKDDDDSDEEIDNEKFRAYELSRLKYYFAVVVCDSIATADDIYKNCDGTEFERSSNKLDLRFIPDSMEFKHPARDVATEAPANYEGIDFQTRALQQTKIDLSWEDDTHRAKKFKRISNVDQEDELELKEFIASSDSESDEDEINVDGGDKKRRKTDAYRALLQSGDGSDEDEDEEDDEKMDMEVTFNTGLEDLSKKILEKKDKKSETTWDAHLRKKKEKKKARKNRSKDSSDDDNESDGGSDDENIEEAGDFFAGDTVAKKKKDSRGKKDKKHETVEDGVAATREELELLLATDDGGDGNHVKGYNLKHKKSKGKKDDDIDEENIPTVDIDKRFASKINLPEFAIDPTDPQYKRSGTYARQVAHKQSKYDALDGQEEHHTIEEAQAPDAGVSNKDKNKSEISMMVKSIKMKSQQLPKPSHGKKSKRKVK